MADQLQVRVDTKSGRATLAAGRPFVGGVYALQVETDGAEDTTRLIRIYRLDPVRQHRWVLAQGRGGTDLHLDSADWRAAFRSVAPSRALPCEIFVYDEDAIVAQGNVVIEWSPTLTTVDGTPVDVRGPAGPQGPQGDKGDKGEDGADGKSAYTGAVEQGYRGTETQFYKELGGLTEAAEKANEAAQNAANAKRGAENAKASADASATAAAGSANAAAKSAQGASSFASAAARSAQTASESVRTIQSTVQSVAGAVSTAQAAAKDADAAKQVAQEAKQGATTAAGNADASAKEAKAQANKANESAQAAAKSAESVSGVVEDVKAQVDRLAQTAQEAESVIGDLASGAAKSAEAAASSAEAAARYADDVVDAKLAAEKSATAANTAVKDAQAAKTAAETAKTQAEAAKDAAATAKSGAEKAKQDAEAAKSAAATSASQAATSATNAASSATQAQEAAEGLQEGLATLNTLDGRVTILETGEGVYKDPATGKVKTFIPFELCADGTLQVQGDGGFFKRIAPVEVGATEVCTPIGDCTYYGFVKGGGDYYADTQVFGYNAKFKRLFRVKIPGAGIAFSDQGYRCANAQFAVWVGTDGLRRCACPNKAGNALCLFELPDANLVTQYVKSVAAPAGWIAATVWYNELSGHLNALCHTDADGYFVVAWDLELNPILAEDGTQRRVSAADWVTYNLSRTSPSVIRVYGRTFVWETGWTTWGGTNTPFALFAATVEDGLEPVHEHIPLPDPDAPGYCQRETDAEGNIVIDDPDLSATRPKLVTEDAGVLLFCAEQPARRKLPSGARNGSPALATCSGIILFTDGVNIYWLTKDGRFINASYCSLNQTARPPYKGSAPTAVTSPWPPNRGSSPVLGFSKGADVHALYNSKTADWSTWRKVCQYMGQVFAGQAKVTNWAADRFINAGMVPGRSSGNNGVLFGRKYSYYTYYDYADNAGGTFGGYLQ